MLQSVAGASSALNRRPHVTCQRLTIRQKHCTALPRTLYRCRAAFSPRVGAKCHASFCVSPDIARHNGLCYRMGTQWAATTLQQGSVQPTVSQNPGGKAPMHGSPALWPGQQGGWEACIVLCKRCCCLLQAIDRAQPRVAGQQGAAAVGATGCSLAAGGAKASPRLVNSRKRVLQCGPGLTARSGILQVER